MKIYRKEGDVIQIISFPEEEVEKGDYLLIEDQKTGKGLIVQVIDIQFANLPGILEDILRDVMTEESLQGSDYDPLEVSSQITVLKDTKLLVCKIRGAVENGQQMPSVSWLPSRTCSRIVRFPIESLMNLNDAKRPVFIGKTKTEADLIVDAKSLDGKLNIITGKKGTGKSHLSKLLVLCLIDHKAPSLVFDVNGEYVNLNRVKGGVRSRYDGKILVLTPRLNLKFTLSDVGLRSFNSMLTFALDLPSTSAKVFSKIWHELEKSGRLDLLSLGEAIQRFECHESVREAIYSRFSTILDSNLFSNSTDESLTFNKLAQKLSDGTAIVVNVKNQSSTIRRMIVELFISKLTELLSSFKLRALFLFAEEAHLYLRDTYWDDIVTRMRHLGIFTTFITNQPDTIQESIYRQADNIFLFNFTNEHDLDVVSRAAKIDADSVKLLVKDLPARHCLIIGEIVRNFPIVVNVNPLEVETMGQTRLFFQD